MDATVKIESTHELSLDIETAAKWFVELDSTQQAKFFSLCESGLTDYKNYEDQFYYIATDADIPAKLFIYRLANFCKANGLGGKNQIDALNTYPAYEREIK